MRSPATHQTTVRWARETLHLLPAPALYWPAEKTLVIADLHLGKAASYRALGQPVPSGSTQDNLERITQLIAQHQAQQAFDRCKQAVKAAGLAGPGKVRVNKAGCLDRCAAGPVAVVYPEGVWYSVANKEDIEEILQAHVRDGGRVPRLMLRPTDKLPADRAAD